MPAAPSPRGRTGACAIPRSLIVAACVGLLVAVAFIGASGARQVADAVALLGWRLLPISLYHLVPLGFSALSWRELISPAVRPRTGVIVWIRWIRESINALLPVAQLGGDIASVRLVTQRGVPGVEGAASMVVDTTVGVGTQLIFILVGVGLLVLRSADGAALSAVWALASGVLLLAVLIAAFVLAQHRGLFASFARLLGRITPENWRLSFPGGAAAIDASVVETYRRRSPFLRSLLLRLAGWAAGAGEVWLVMACLGRPLSLADAFILESLNSGVRAAAFMVPGALGAQEGGLVIFGGLLGVPADLALALSLAKRVRELLLGLPGLVAWQWAEGRRLIPRREAL